MLLKMMSVNLGTDAAGGKDVTSAQTNPEKASVCQSGQTVEEQTTQTHSAHENIALHCVGVYCMCCLSATCTVCASLFEKTAHESPLSLARGSAASQLKEGMHVLF